MTDHLKLADDIEWIETIHELGQYVAAHQGEIVSALRQHPSAQGPNSEAVEFVKRMLKSAEEGELYGFADSCKRLLSIMNGTTATVRTEP